MMARSFTEFAFTPSVRAMQKAQGAAGVTGSLLHEETDAFDRFTDNEKKFIESRDSFYQATVTETDWPYVQHRGGPAGFLKVLDEKTLGYADYSGNRQYLSDGNLHSNDRVSLILMDYVNRRRLKIWGRARLVEKKEDPELIEKLHDKEYRALAERAVLIDLEAFDWNCPRHIEPRLTKKELEPEFEKLLDQLGDMSLELERLRQENEELKKDRE